MTAPDWKAGTGYPSSDAPADVWEFQFLSRGDQGLNGRPHFKLAPGSVEFFGGPAIIQINDDGSLPGGAEIRRSGATHMVIEFQLNHDIAAQIERARVWLSANQRHRFIIEKRRMREAKFVLYLRALDGQKSGASLDEIARVLYPTLDNAYPSHDGRKQAGKALTAARKLARRGLRAPLNRR